MKYLLDTHTLLWYLNDDAQLPALAKACIEDAQHELYVSIASFWEITIKSALGKLHLQTTIREIHAAVCEQEMTIMPITIAHLTRLHTLPSHHRDPFDRLLIAQAIEENFSIISGDHCFAAYSVRVIWQQRSMATATDADKEHA